MAKKVVGIDPGLQGAFVVTDGMKFLEAFEMPVSAIGKIKEIRFQTVNEILELILDRHKGIHIFLEKPVSFGMGTKGAFNYGRGFEALSIAIQMHEVPCTLVEPAKWAKEMHQGISNNLKPKVKSLVAVKRLYPHLVGSLPQKPKGGYMDGSVDALLIAGWGLRHLGECEDFF